MARDCTEPKNMANVQCRNCDEYGHMSKECPKPRDSKSSSALRPFSPARQLTCMFVQSLASSVPTARRWATSNPSVPKSALTTMPTREVSATRTVASTTVLLVVIAATGTLAPPPRAMAGIRVPPTLRSPVAALPGSCKASYGYPIQPWADFQEMATTGGYCRKGTTLLLLFLVAHQARDVWSGLEGGMIFA